MPESPFPEALSCSLIKKETLAQVFSCEICKISKNTFFDRTPLLAASDSENLIDLEDNTSIYFLSF